ncbi:TPA: hypothetical protein ACGUPP_004617 [Vibrio vulnificus]
MVVCIERAGKIHITKRSRGIHAAWHFWFAVSFGDESGLREVGLCGIHPLTQRYVFRTERGNNDKENTGFTLSGGYFL